MRNFVSNIYRHPQRRQVGTEALDVILAERGGSKSQHLQT